MTVTKKFGHIELDTRYVSFGVGTNAIQQVSDTEEKISFNPRHWSPDIGVQFTTQRIDPKNCRFSVVLLFIYFEIGFRA